MGVGMCVCVCVEWVFKRFKSYMCGLISCILFSCSYHCLIHTVRTLLYLSLQTHILSYSCLYRTHFVYIVYDHIISMGSLLYAQLFCCQPVHRGEGGLVRRRGSWVNVHMSNSILCQYSMDIRCTCRSHEWLSNWTSPCLCASLPMHPPSPSKKTEFRYTHRTGQVLGQVDTYR